jgi:hypothetical protein
MAVAQGLRSFDEIKDWFKKYSRKEGWKIVQYIVLPNF